MHISRWLALVTLLPTSTLAFYPLPRVTGDEPSVSSKYGAKDRRFFPWRDSSAASTRDGSVPTLSIKKVRSSKGKRANNYPVVLASPPSMNASMAIDEDGQDFSYFSMVDFGSKGKQLYMLIDTGAGNTWVMGSACTSPACQAHNTFGPPDSTTLNLTETPWNVSYGTGTVNGVVASDTVAFAGFHVELGFGSAISASDDFNAYPMDGILGLGRPGANTLDTPTVMQVLDSANLLEANLIGVHLQRNSDGATDGEINFGATDPSKYSGDLGYTKTLTLDGLWEIPADDAGFNGQSCNFTNRSAIIDTGTSYILMPPGDAQILHSHINGSTQNNGNFLIPCSTTAPVQFTFSGVTYNISSKDYLGKPDSTGTMCVSNIVGHQAFGPTSWLLGDVFLKNVYSVFDFDNNRIGFGVKHTTNSTTQTSPTATPNPASSSSSSSSSPSHSHSSSHSSSLSSSSERKNRPSSAVLVCIMGLLLGLLL